MANAQLQSAWASGVAQLRASWASAQIGRPLADTSAGTWVASTGPDLWAMLDEYPYSDVDYISTPSFGTCEIALNDTTFPGTANQTLAYRASSVTGNGITVTLKQGATTIASWSHSLTPADTLYTQTLTAPQIASITAGALSVTLTST